MSEESQISKFYASKKIFVTGATGFMGEVLVWKLLHNCSQLDTIFVLIRSKYGKSSTSRKTEFFNSPVFENFKKHNPSIFEKVVLIPGDVGEEGLGLSDSDRDMLIDEISIIFHGAAILNMDADLRTAVNVNTTGTVRLLELAQKMKKLESFVYMSTAYCCCEKTTVEEKMYPAKHNPYKIMDLVQWMEPQLLANITPKLIYPLPNTYIYSKRLTESILNDHVSKVPIIVARPSIIISCSKEPLPGWNSTLNGPLGIYVAGGRGILRTTSLKVHGKTNVIPCDYAINSMLILPWANSREQLLKEINVYNITQNFFDGLTWQEMLDRLMNSLAKCPVNIMLWYPNTHPGAKSLFEYKIKCIFLHYLPAYLIDFILRLAGQKPVLVRAHNKLGQAEKVLRYFTQTEWLFAHDKILQLEELMNPTDKRLFPVNMKQMGDLQSYFDDFMVSAKFHILKEDRKHETRAKIILKIMYVVDKIVLILRYYLLWKLMVFIFNTLWNTFEGPIVETSISRDLEI